MACVSPYVVGFGTSYWFGQLVKMAIIDDSVLVNVLNQVVVRFDRTVAGHGVLDVGDLLQHFYALAAGKNQVPGYVGIIGKVTTYLVLLAFAGSTMFAAIHAYTRGQLGLLRDVGFVCALMLVNVPQFMLTDDLPFRTARFVFVPYGLCLSCLMLVLCRARSCLFSSSLLLPFGRRPS